MAEEENFENEGGGQEQGREPGAETTETPWAPSKEDWDKLVSQNQVLGKELADFKGMLTEPEVEPFDPDQIDLTDPRQLAQLVDMVVDYRLQSVTPYVRNAAQDQGKRQMEVMFKSLEGELKDEFPAGFDPKLAERAAFAFFDETGDAEASVAAAARYAAETRKNERESGINEYRSKNTRRSFEEPGTEGSAISAEKPMKTFDEVLEKWGSQTEV